MAEVDIQSLQHQKLKAIYPYICSSPFYEKKLPSNIRNSDFDPALRLSNIPFTTKDDLRFSSPLERTPLNLAEIAAFFSSSGTTGKPSSYVWSKHDQEIYCEISSRILRNIQGNASDVVLLPMSMGMSFSWYGILSEMQQLGAAVIPLGTAATEEIIKGLVDYPVTILKTSPVVASRVIRAIIKDSPNLLNKLKLRQIHLAGYYSSNAHRKRLEKRWGVDCYDMYGLSELGLVSGDCPAKNGQHYCADYALVEVIRPTDFCQASPGETGVAVYTTLWKKASPLLRYWSDDFIYIDESPCSCGMQLPRLFHKGRLVDSIVVGQKRVFASDVEQILFQNDAIADEYRIELFGSRSNCHIKVQAEVEYPIQTAGMEEKLYDLFEVPVVLDQIPLDSLVREKLKPNRISDFRTS